MCSTLFRRRNDHGDSKWTPIVKRKSTLFAYAATQIVMLATMLFCPWYQARGFKASVAAEGLCKR
jgi:hypothetical protein